MTINKCWQIFENWTKQETIKQTKDCFAGLLFIHNQEYAKVFNTNKEEKHIWQQTNARFSFERLTKQNRIKQTKHLLGCGWQPAKVLNRNKEDDKDKKIVFLGCCPPPWKIHTLDLNDNMNLKQTNSSIYNHLPKQKDPAIFLAC